MKIGFLEKIRQGRAVDYSRTLGYSAVELDKIEHLYNITITGDFRDFMLEIGRCSGGLVSDESIILYRNAWDIRTQLFTQFIFLNDLQDAGLYNLLQPQPFLFSIEWETRYYFLFTGGSNPDSVFCYDENTKKLTETGLTFLEYIHALVRANNLEKSDVICQGELVRL